MNNVVPTAVDTEQVRKLIAQGAQLIDVLPAENFKQERIPGAINIPMDRIAEAPTRLDKHVPVVAYCHDHQCDLSSRAAARLESLGFTDVYDYVDSKVAWFAEGLPSEGFVDDSARAIAKTRRDVPTLPPDARLGEVRRVLGEWELVAVIDDANVVLGVVSAEAADVAVDAAALDVMQPAPATVRPSIPLRELAETMDKHGESHVLVTTLHGELIGLVRRSELDAA